MPDRQTTTDQPSTPDPSPGVRAARARRTPPPDGGSDAGVPPRQAADDPGAAPDRPAEPADEREPFPGWPPRDILAPFVLLAVSLERSHGYGIEDYLRALGLFGITMSTLYRTLRQMEKDGFLESTWEPGPTGPARRMYSITDAGHVWLDSSAAMLTAYRDTIDRFFGLYGAGPVTSRDRPDEPANEKETPA
jgi:poly-beta-hydroxybutyrate-responsive repressor